MKTINEPVENKGKAMKTLLTLGAIILILGVATAGGVYIVKSTPKAKRQIAVKEAPLVEAITLETTLEQVRVSATGTVIPAEEVALKSEVKGRVVAIKKSFELGSQVSPSDNLLQLEPADYQLAVAQAESTVAQAAYDLSLEQGNQEIAQQEWELYDNKDNASQNDKDLALRKPHLLKAQAAYRSAQAELALAKLNLERTIVFAPFNAMVISKNVDPGSYVAAQETVATLVNTDRYWIQVSIPVDRLQWIDIPQNDKDQGSMVQISSAGRQKLGKVHRLLPDLTDSGRMAQLLVEITDPLDLKKEADQREPLLLGEYVRVEIDGKMLDNVISVPRDSVHDGSKIWLLDGDQQLQIAEADIIWRDSDRVLLRNNLPQRAQLVTTNLSAAIAGMQLRAENTKVAYNDLTTGADNE